MTSRARILVADDDKLIRMNLHLVLGRAGYDVDTAADGREAMDLLDRGSYEVVVTELDLTGPSGLEILDRTRALSPGTKVILLTASAVPPAPLDAGPAGVVAKPFGLATLVEQVRRTVGPDSPPGM